MYIVAFYDHSPEWKIWNLFVIKQYNLFIYSLSYVNTLYLVNLYHVSNSIGNRVTHQHALEPYKLAILIFTSRRIQSILRSTMFSVILLSFPSSEGGNAQPMCLRVRRSIEQPDYPWHVRYVGQPEVGDKNKHTLVRSCIDVGTTGNVAQFLQEMGFKLVIQGLFQYPISMA